MKNKKDFKTFVPVIYDCNDNCISCPVPRRKNKENPTFKDILREVNDILKISKHIELNGGEPTLRKDLLRILEYISQKNPEEVGLLTNSQSFYYKDFAKKISKIPHLKIVTTLYGPNAKIHDSITRTPNSFRYKIRGIKNLIKNNVPLEIRILLHRLNYSYFDQIADFLINNFDSKDFVKVIIMNPKLTEQAKKNERLVAIKLTELAKVLENPIKRLIKNGYKVELYHFPNCVLPSSLFGLSKGLTVENSEVTFLKKCKDCAYKKKCSGVWGSYLRIFGGDEFRPIEYVLHKKEIVQRIKRIPKNDDFYLDKIYFLLGLKEVLRIELKGKKVEDAIVGLEKIPRIKEGDYLFLSQDIRKAESACELTNILNSGTFNERDNLKFNLELGSLYGYPECCVRKFSKKSFTSQQEEKKLISKTRFPLNGKELTLLYYPCSENCKETKRLKSLIISKLKELDLFRNEN